MDKDEAEMQANMAAVETYLEQIGDWTSQKEDDNPATWARKRSATCVSTDVDVANRRPRTGAVVKAAADTDGSHSEK